MSLLSFVLTSSSLLVIAGATVAEGSPDLTDLKQELLNRISDRLVLEDKEAIPHVQPLQQKGVYDCIVRFNFAGECWRKELRHRVGFFDNNPYVAIWVNILLLEASLYGTGKVPSDAQVGLSLEYLETTLDKTHDYKSSSVGFYSYVFDESKQKYVMRKLFLEQMLNMLLELPNKIVDGFDYVIPKEMQAVLASRNETLPEDNCLNDVSDKRIQQEIASSGFLAMIHHTANPVFPPDADDTFSWVGLGAVLNLASKRAQNVGPQITWASMNTNITSAFDALKKYSYQPFSDDGNKNTIDSRSYMAYRSFLEEAHAKGETIALTTTWFANIEEEFTGECGEMNMPTLVNDVDLAVTANVIYGISSAVLTGMVSPTILDDPEILQLYLNGTSLIQHMVENNFFEREDLSILYYPPKLQFFFYLSRTLFLLETYRNEDVLPRPIMETVYQKFNHTLTGLVTEYILEAANRDAVHQLVFFEEFIGNGDISPSGEPLHRGEDRIYSTAMAANALLYIWSTYDRSSGTISWKRGIPETIPAIVTGCVHWLNQYVIDSSLKPWNAFFSSGRKGVNNLPFWYPANRFQYRNGTNMSQPLPQEVPQEMFFAAMQGHVSPEEYSAMLNESRFGRETPLVHPSYNAPGWNSFAFWSSEAYTYALAHLALSLYEAVN